MFDTPETEPNAEELETDVELEEPTPEDESLEEDSGDTETDEEGQETDDDDGEEFLTLDGEDITLEEIREMKKGNLRQEDYTRKTQALADGKKQSLELNDRLTTTITALESMIDEEENSTDLDELLDVDPAEYIRRQNKLKAKKGKLTEAREAQHNALLLRQADESQKLLTVMEGWGTGKKGQEQQQRDINAGLKYAGQLGFTEKEIGQIADHRVLKAIIDAGKFSDVKASKPAVTKRKAVATKRVSSQKVAKKGKETEQKTLGDFLYGGG